MTTNLSDLSTHFALQLFYRFTTGLLFLSCALIGIPELTGKNIQCHGHSGDGDHFKQMVEQYCWVTGTYTVPDMSVVNIYE